MRTQWLKRAAAIFCATHLTLLYAAEVPAQELSVKEFEAKTNTTTESMTQETESYADETKEITTHASDVLEQQTPEETQTEQEMSAQLQESEQQTIEEIQTEEQTEAEEVQTQEQTEAEEIITTTEEETTASETTTVEDTTAEESTETAALETEEETGCDANADPATHKQNGLIHIKDYVWHYVKDGHIRADYTGLVLYDNNWYYVEKGILNWNYSGIVQWNNENWRVTNGVATEKVASHIVCIDAGHQAYGMSQKEPNGPGSSVMKAMLTTGSAGIVTRQPEYELNLAVALKLKAELLNRGYQVVMIREDNNCPVSNAQRAVYANNSGAEIFVRIHANGSANTSVRGAMAYGPSSANPYMASNVTAASQSLTNTLLNKFCATTGLLNKGVLLDDTMTGINWCTIPVTIIEMGFLSNPDEDRLMATDSFRTVMARGIADGIDAYFGQ